VSSPGKGIPAEVRFSDLERAVLSLLLRGFPILDKHTELKFSDALFVFRKHQFVLDREGFNCAIDSLNVNQVNSDFGARADVGFGSIFSRHGFTEPDGSPIRITTHQFRHHLNTIAQAGCLDQLDIAKWSGRTNVHQNSNYDHVTSDQIVALIRSSIGDDSRMFGPLSRLPVSALIRRGEFAILRVPTAHTTDIGFCIHDYAMSPCQLHRDCINCKDLVCVKGDLRKEEQLRKLLNEARALLQKTEEASLDKYAGSDRWLEHHKMTVKRLSELSAILADPDVPVGSIVQLYAPERRSRLGSGPSVLVPTSALTTSPSLAPTQRLFAGYAHETRQELDE
jgi:hypothetical protein